MEYREKVIGVETSYNLQLNESEGKALRSALRFYIQQYSTESDENIVARTKYLHGIAHALKTTLHLRWDDKVKAESLDSISSALQEYIQALSSASTVMQVAGIDKPEEMSQQFRDATELMYRFQEETEVVRLRQDVADL